MPYVSPEPPAAVTELHGECPEKVRLVHEIATAANEVAILIAQRHAAKNNKEELLAIKKLIKATRVRGRDATTALREHLQSHGC